MFADRFLSNYAINRIKTKLIRKIGLELYHKSIVKNPNQQFVSENYQPKNLLPVYWCIFLVASCTSKNSFLSTWRRDAPASLDSVTYHITGRSIA